MSIQANEFIVTDGPKSGVWVHVADRRISVKGKYHSNQKKVFYIPHLKATIGYFGLAQASQTIFFSSLLPDIIRHSAGVNSLAEFSSFVCYELNKRVSKPLLRQNPSGLHLAGFAPDGLPEFHFIRSFGGMRGAIYRDLTTTYYATEDLRGRDLIDAAKKLGGVITDVRDVTFYYVNGDLRSFWDFWLGATAFVDKVAGQGHLTGLESPSSRARWKLEAFAAFYERYSREKIIGRPVDAYEIRA